MKLLYAYLDNFRGIRQTELRFDDEFYVLLDKKAQSISIKKNHAYQTIPDYYGKNISDIVLLIGDNGSGKTSILELLTYPFYSLNGENNGAVFFCIFLMDNGDFYIRDELNYVKNISYENIEKSLYKIRKIEKGFILETHDLKSVKHYESLSFLLLDCHNHFNWFGNGISNNDYVHSFVRKVRKEHLFKLINKTHYESGLPRYFKTLNFKLKISYKGVPDVRKKPFFLYNGQLGHLISHCWHICSFSFKEAFIICALEQCILKRISLFDSKKKAMLYERMNIKIHSEKWIFDEQFFLSYKKRREYLFSMLEIVLQGQEFAIKAFISNLERIRSNQFESYDTLDLKGVNNNLSYLFSSLDNNVINVSEAAFYDVVSFDFGKMSSGETSLLILIASLLGTLDEIPQKNVCILLDEPDVWLHMEWQRNIIKYLVNSINSLNKKIKCSFIITTHSPYIVTDIFKNKIIPLGAKKSKSMPSCGLLSNLGDITTSNFFVKYPIGEYAKNRLLHYRKELIKGNVTDDAILYIKSICDINVKKYLLYNLPENTMNKLKNVLKDGGGLYD